MTDIFVFGSNRLGVHGAGAARFARLQHGAIYGQGEGLQGASYALPTKRTPYVTLELSEIREHIERFKAFAASRLDLTFYVTPVGCGLAGYDQRHIKPLFEPLPPNCRYSKEWTI